ncbi:MAG: FlgD immunoglobulin-like domain containing protein [bacterium]
MKTLLVSFCAISIWGSNILLAQPDFTIIGLPDTQYYSAGWFGGSPEIFKAQTQWIVDNKDSLNIVFVAHFGDVVEIGDIETQWVNANTALSILENPETTGASDGIPYGIAVGCHDQSPLGNPFGSSTALYNKYFGIERFSDRRYYGGHFGTNNDTHFAIFSASGLDFLVIFIELFGRRVEGTLAWADSVMKAHSDRHAIVVNHAAVIGNGAPPNSEGQDIYEALKDNPNFFLMLCGHWYLVEYRGELTHNDNTVYSLLANYQFRDDCGNCVRTNGGNGWLRIMQFSPANNEIRVKTYSPTLDSFRTQASSEFVLPYSMQSPTSVGNTVFVPNDFTLNQNYPNPFNPTTIISYQLSERTYVKLAIHNTLGQHVKTLVQGFQISGEYEVEWDGRNVFGESVSSGLYLYHLRAGSFSQTRKMILMR